MDTRTAILAAADHIERHPADFRFTACSVPRCGSPGCALGWISYFAGAEGGEPFDTVLINGLMDAPMERWNLGECSSHPHRSYGFYNRMDAINRGWYYDAGICAANLRIYADIYHPALDAIPSTVREIFTERVAEPA